MHTLSQYLITLSDPDGLTRTLGAVEVCRDPSGRMCFSVGNSAAVFRIRHQGRIRSLRCYLRPQRHLREIYGGRLLERELYLYTSPDSGVWVDVVIGDWIEGEDLHTSIARAATEGDTRRLGELAEAFDRLAAPMVADDRAHGDLKPENILVDAAGRLHVIDLDASFLPGMKGETSPELGTAAYQHPARTAADFNARLDDYPAALISTALHALALDPTMWKRYGKADALLYDPRRAATDPALCETLGLFETRGMALAYRIAQLLRAPRPELPDLSALLAEAVRRADRERSEGGGEKRTDASRRTKSSNRRRGSGVGKSTVGRGGLTAGVVCRGRPLGLPHTGEGDHSAALRQRIRLHRGAGRRTAGPHVALHRPAGAHPSELPGVSGRQALPRRLGPDSARRPLAENQPRRAGI